ncbi:hypothetical protein [Epilithonimonas sp.]|uniref:hypothetical protein n=1 Tax=Epilithonimonas sp. TaxID=2894511 RepID=UPI0035B41350
MKAARPEWKSFFVAGKAWQKDWERRTEIAAQIIINYLEWFKVTTKFIKNFDVKYL